MLMALLAHQGGPSAMHDMWQRWNADPLVIVGLAAAMWSYHRGARPSRRERNPWRARCFWLAIAAIAMAMLSPLDPLAAELASAHMVQHVLLILVAAPCLAYSAPLATMLAGTTRFVRAGSRRARHLLRAAHRAVAAIRRPTVAWLAHAATLWLWHASVPYEAALRYPAVHALEHALFLGTGVLFWSVLRPARGAAPTVHGYGALLTFAMAMQSVFLAALLTFASTPWYATYRETSPVWGLEPLADQQLAGVIMWVPAGLIYVGLGVLLVATWVRGTGSGLDVRVEDDWVGGTAPESPLSLR